MYIFELQFSLDICPGVGLLGHIVVLFLGFREISILFFTVVAPVSIPTNSVGGSHVVACSSALFTLVAI